MSSFAQSAGRAQGKILCFRCRKASCACVAAWNGLPKPRPAPWRTRPKVQAARRVLRTWALALAGAAIAGGAGGALLASCLH